MSVKKQVAARLQLLEVAMTPEDFQKDAEKSVEYFNKEIKRIFPKAQFINAKMSNIFVKNSGISFAFAYDKPAIIDNSKTLLSFMMHLANRQGKIVDKNDFEIVNLRFAHELGKHGANVKYRKIKGKTPMEATKKLVAWFKKNKDAITKTGE